MARDNEPNRPAASRRRYIAALGSALVTGAAGCLGGGGGGGGTPTDTDTPTDTATPTETDAGMGAGTPTETQAGTPTGTDTSMGDGTPTGNDTAAATDTPMGDGTPAGNGTAAGNDTAAGNTSNATPVSWDQEEIALDQPVELYTWNLPFLEESINGWRDDFTTQFEPKYEFADPATEWVDRGPGTETILSYFQSRLQGGDPPNIFDTQMATYTRYAQDDIWASLDQWASEEFLSNYYERLRQVMTRDGSLLQMPFYMGTMATYSRNQWFEEAGEEPPGLQEDSFYSTMDYLDLVETVTNNSGAEFGLTFIRFNWQLWPWFRAAGVDVLNDDQTQAAFNTDTTHQILSRFRELTQDGIIPEVSWTGDWQPAAQQFGAGNTAMYYGSQSALRLIQNAGDWVAGDTVTMGGAPSGERYGGLMTMHGLGVVKPNQSEASQQAAFDLISVIVNEKWQKDFLRNTTVLVPNQNALSDLREDEEFASENPLLTDIYALWDNVSADIWVPPLIPAASRMSSIIDTQFSAAALGEKSVDAAISTAESNINSAIQN